MTAPADFSDDRLMAFADGEGDDAERSAIAQAIDRDPAMAARVARHRALRANIAAAFEPVLDEPLPRQLAALVDDPATSRNVAPVITLATVRAARLPGVGDSTRARQPSWWAWGGMAASLVVGVLAGLTLRTTDGSPDRSGAPVAAADPPAILTSGGQLIANGTLASALSHQLASTQAAASGASLPVRIGVSFVTTDGTYCRSFTLQADSATTALAGLACREKASWQIPVLSEAAADKGTYRPAASTLPPAVAAMVDARIQGAPLGAEAERKAMEQDWRR